jgi:hypothetical protein
LLSENQLDLWKRRDRLSSLRDVSSFSFFLFLLIADVHLALAEFECSSEISYKWKRETEEMTVYVETVFKKGDDEESSKRALDMFSKAKEGRALKLCADTHENQAGCLTARTSMHSQILNLSSYAVRKDIQKAIQDDCKKQSGECRGVLRSDAVCREVFSPVAADAADKKKEKGKGKK